MRFATKTGLQPPGIFAGQNWPMYNAFDLEIETDKLGSGLLLASRLFME